MVYISLKYSTVPCISPCNLLPPLNNFPLKIWLWTSCRIHTSSIKSLTKYQEEAGDIFPRLSGSRTSDFCSWKKKKWGQVWLWVGIEGTTPSPAFSIGSPLTFGPPPVQDLVPSTHTQGLRPHLQGGHCYPLMGALLLFFSFLKKI